VRDDSRRVNKRMVRSQASRSCGSSAPDAGSVGHAIGSTSASGNTRRTEEVLVVVVMLAVVLAMTVAGDSNGRAGESQNGEFGVDRRHLFESDDEKDKKPRISVVLRKGVKKVLLLERLEQKPTRAFGLLKERE